VVDENNGKIN